MTKRILDIVDEPGPYWPLPKGLAMGDWVHTAEPVIVPWSAPKWSKSFRTGKRERVHSNCHKCEGRLARHHNGGLMIDTGIIPPPPKYHWQSRRRNPYTVMVNQHNFHLIRPGPLKRKPGRVLMP